MADAEAKLNFKLGRHEPGVGVVEHRYDDAYELREVDGREAVVMAPSGNQIGLLVQLSRLLEPPLSLVYVLLIPFGAYAEGRYELAKPLDHEALELFLDRFREFFEGDARHHLVIGTSPQLPQLVYDQHNLLYAYLPRERVLPLLERRGFRRGSTELPSPHSHHAHSDFDGTGATLLGSLKWTWEPLRESD